MTGYLWIFNNDVTATWTAVRKANPIYNFTPHFWGICSCSEFPGPLCTCQHEAAKYGERVGSATNYSKLWCWSPSTCASSAHWKTVFHQPLRCSLCLQVHFGVDNFLLSGQNVTCSRGFLLQSDWYRQSKAAEVDNFSPRCYHLPGSLLPLFLRKF